MCGNVIEKGRTKQNKASRKGFLEDVKCEILKIENNPSGESQFGSGYGPTRAGTMPVMLTIISQYMEM